jgi:hypothetical protein
MLKTVNLNIQEFSPSSLFSLTYPASFHKGSVCRRTAARNSWTKALLNNLVLEYVGPFDSKLSKWLLSCYYLPKYDSKTIHVGFLVVLSFLDNFKRNISNWSYRERNRDILSGAHHLGLSTTLETKTMLKQICSINYYYFSHTKSTH